MGVNYNPKISSDGLLFSIDPSNKKSISPLGCTGFNGAPQLIKNMISPTDIIFSYGGTKLGNLTYYTAFSIDYPEGSFGGDAAGRDGITQGYNVRTGTKLFDFGRALNYAVWNKDTQTWVKQTTYDSYAGTAAVDTFVSEYNQAVISYPRAIHLVAGSHRDTYHTAAQYNILKDLGAPNNVDSIINFSSPEWILIGEPGLKAGNAYGWAFQNYSTNPEQVAHLNFGLPIYGNISNYLQMDGVDDYIETSNINLSTSMTYNIIYKLNDPSSGWGPLFRTDWRERIFPSTIVLINSTGTYYNLSGPDGTTDIINICYSYNGTNAKSYKNGKLQSNITMSAPMDTGLYNFRFGNQSSGSSNGYSNCHIYYIGIYNRQLSDIEVMKNFNAIRGRYGL